MFQLKLKLILGAIAAAGSVLSLHAQMAQDPLLSRTAAVEPNIVFMFDDSGSMPAKAIYQFGGTPGGLGLTGPNNDSFDVMFADQVSFHGRSPDVNRIYYDPRTSYARRIRADSTYLPAGATTGITSFNVYFYKPASSTTYRVNNVPVTARGSGYPAAGVTALFSAPPSGGVRATADVVTATSPKVGAVNVLNGGIGYPTTGVTVTFGPPGAGGVQATGTVTTGNSTTKAVSGVSIVAGGAGYANSTQVVFSDPPAGGVTATGTVTRGGGPRPISTFTLTDPGSGYITPPTVTLTSTGGGVGATFAVTLANVPTRVVTGINVTNGGSGYSAPVPVILNNTGGGSGASFAVTLGTTNVISAINVTNPGSGYVSPPTLALNGTAPGSGEAYTVNTTAIVVQPANMVWDGTGAPTAAANYFTPLYTPDSGSPLAPGAAVLPYPNTAASTTGSYPKFKNRTDCSPATATSCTWAQELQNYANWKAYHSTRLELAKTGIGLAFQPLNPTFRLGWGTINTLANSSRLDSGVRLYNSTVQSDFLTWLYGIPANGSTPNRIALDKVGTYYQRADNGGPWANAPTGNNALTSSGAEDRSHATCRRSYAMLMTDGYYNDTFSQADTDTTIGPRISEPTAYQYTPVGPYSDTASGSAFRDSFADVAMKYWLTDLRPNLNNGVRSLGSDEAYWQHMNFYAIGLGLTGTLDATDPQVLQRLSGGLSTTPPRSLDWPTPAPNSPRSIDDMWHATVNGRGRLLNAKTTDELNRSILQMMSDIGGKEGTQSGVAVSTANLTRDTKKYTPSYTPISWNGNVTAYTLDATNGNQTGIAWQVETLVSTDPLTGARTYASLIPSAASRNIYVGTGGSSGTRAVPFNYSAMNAAGLTSSMTGTVNAALIDYLRGDPVNEDSSSTSSSSTAIYRGRETRLADIVNSTPVYVKDTLDLGYQELPLSTPGKLTYGAFVTAKKQRTEGVLFVGANDGMLHAFRDGTPTAQGGVETFAYVPNALLPTLNQLADKAYVHRYYVDGPNVETDAYFTGGTPRWANIVLGSTGAGAGAPASAGVSPRTAVYALDVTSLNTNPTSMNASSVLWEVSSSNTSFAELGHVLTDVQAGPTVGGQWIAIFGNGYESRSCQARLFVVNLETGALIKEINTFAGNCSTAKNGLGGVRLVRNGNQQVVGVYAGDLLGNVWKFSLNDLSSANWKVDLGGIPLFTAGPTQPITAPPSVIKLDNTSVPSVGNMVIVGTGKFFEVSDITTTARQSLYGIWDAVAFGAATIPAGTALTNKSLMVEQTISAGVARNGNTFYTLSQNPVDYVGTTTPSVVAPRRGWWINLPITGQRMVYPMDILANRFTVADTISPANVSLDPCSNTSGGTGYLYVINALTGAGPTAAVLDTNGDGRVNTQDLIDTNGDGTIDGRDGAPSGIESKADGRNVTLLVDKNEARETYVNCSGGSPGCVQIELTCGVLGKPCNVVTPSRIKSREWRQLFLR